jgi:hypothetical protein
MTNMLRKIFGIMALIWLGWVALNVVIFGVSLATAAVGGPQRSAETGAIGMVAAGMFLVSVWTAEFIGIPSCLAWLGLKLVQVLGQPKNVPPYPSTAYGRQPWRATAPTPTPNAVFFDSGGMMFAQNRG